MENATKALIIAGGMFITLILLTLMAALAVSISDVAEGQDRKQLTEQIIQFNKGYEAYNKSKMYGMDVITVTNKAIEHNKIIAATEAEPHYINIKIETEETFETTVTEIDNTRHNGRQRKLTGSNITTEIKTLLGNPSNSYDAYLEGDELYELGTWQSDGQIFIMNNNFINFFSGSTIDKTVNSTKDRGSYVEKKTYVMRSALTNFKIAIFKCTDIEYNNDGRVSSMTFSQI